MVEGKEKLIYVHVVMLGESSKEELTASEYTNATNIWYVIKQARDCSDGSDGAKMMRVFEDVNQLNHPHHAFLDTYCEVIGSCIHVIGGSVSCVEDSIRLVMTRVPASNRHDGHLPPKPWGYAGNVDDNKEDEEREREIIQLDRFCIIQDIDGDDINELHIYYTRFSVFNDRAKPAVAIEDRQSFCVHGCRVLNVVAIKG